MHHPSSAVDADTAVAERAGQDPHDGDETVCGEDDVDQTTACAVAKADPLASADSTDEDEDLVVPASPPVSIPNLLRFSRPSHVQSTDGNDKGGGDGCGARATPTHMKDLSLADVDEFFTPSHSPSSMLGLLVGAPSARTKVTRHPSTSTLSFTSAASARSISPPSPTFTSMLGLPDDPAPCQATSSTLKSGKETREQHRLRLLVESAMALDQRADLLKQASDRMVYALPMMASLPVSSDVTASRGHGATVASELSSRRASLTEGMDVVESMGDTASHAPRLTKVPSTLHPTADAVIKAPLRRSSGRLTARCKPVRRHSNASAKSISIADPTAATIAGMLPTTLSSLSPKKPSEKKRLAAPSPRSKSPYPPPLSVRTVSADSPKRHPHHQHHPLHNCTTSDSIPTPSSATATMSSSLPTPFTLPPSGIKQQDQQLQRAPPFSPSSEISPAATSPVKASVEFSMEAFGGGGGEGFAMADARTTAAPGPFCSEAMFDAFGVDMGMDASMGGLDTGCEGLDVGVRGVGDPALDAAQGLQGIAMGRYHSAPPGLRTAAPPPCVESARGAVPFGYPDAYAESAAYDLFHPRAHPDMYMFPEAYCHPQQQQYQAYPPSLLHTRGSSGATAVTTTSPATPSNHSANSTPALSVGSFEDWQVNTWAGASRAVKQQQPSGSFRSVSSTPSFDVMTSGHGGSTGIVDAGDLDALSMLMVETSPHVPLSANVAMSRSRQTSSSTMPSWSGAQDAMTAFGFHPQVDPKQMGQQQMFQQQTAQQGPLAYQMRGRSGQQPPELHPIQVQRSF